MNLPEIFLIEPYNAYSPKGRKKHWHEVIEEQALFARMIAEQQAIMEANSRTLPPNSPPTSGPTVGNPAGGAGGVPPPQFFNPTWDAIDFTATPLLGAAPLTVVFTNLTSTPELDSYLWDFGDGETSTEANPTHVYQTGSTDGLGYTASLQVSNSVTSAPGGIKTRDGYITASIPTVTALFTYITSSGPGPVTVTFTNGTINTSQTPTTTYLWNFGSGSATSSSISPVFTYNGTGSFTSSLQATGSYGIASKYTQSFFVPAPTLVSSFTYTTSSIYGPVTALFTTTTTYNGNSPGIVYGANAWVFGDGTTNSYEASQTHSYANTGSFTASLQATESLYNIKSNYTQSFFVQAPQITASFTFTTASVVAPYTVTFVNTTIHTGSGTLIYRWDLGSGSITSSLVIPEAPSIYTVGGSYTASLQVTESAYTNIMSFYTQSWSLA